MKREQDTSIEIGTGRITQTETEDYFTRHGTKVDVPVSYLWGRQAPKEYSRGPEYRIKSAINQMGIDFLRQKPVLGTIVPDERMSASRIIVIDGHGRSRFAPAFGIRRIPSLITDLRDMSAWAEERPDELASRLNEQAGLAYMKFGERFEKNGRSLPLPLTMPIGIRAIELPEYIRQIQSESVVGQAMQPAVAYTLHSRR